MCQGCLWCGMVYIIAAVTIQYSQMVHHTLVIAQDCLMNVCKLMHVARMLIIINVLN